jgi:hypothetical protein
MTLNNKMPAEPEFDQQTEAPPRLTNKLVPANCAPWVRPSRLKHVFSLDLEVKDGLYVVRGKVTAADYAQSSFSRFTQDFISAVVSALTGGPRRSNYEIALSYHLKDIEELDSKGRAHRRNGDHNPDRCGLAQKLRAVGSFLDYLPETTLQKYRSRTRFDIGQRKVESRKRSKT